MGMGPREDLELDQKIIVDAIGKHLDSLETIINTMILLSVASAWAGIRRSSEIDAFGTKLNRKHAFFALSCIYLLANIAVLLLFWRLADLILLLEKSSVTAGLTKLATHRWILNPFSYFGPSTISSFFSSAGFGLLIAVWWLGNTSLSTLMDDKQSKAAKVLLALFLAIGLFSMGAINRCYIAILSAFPNDATELRAEILSSAHYREILTFVGIAIGGTFFFFANYLQSRLAPSIKIWSQSPQKPSGTPIAMRGLPIHLSGWNGRFQEASIVKNGKSVWVRPSHWYKGFLPLRIVGTAIWFDGESWVLHRDGDSDDKVFARSLHSAELPTGEWERGIEVLQS